MKKQEVQQILGANHNGAYTNIVYMSDIQVDKDHKDKKVQKMVAAVTCFGVAYSHIQVDTIQFKNRTKEEPGTLPWGEWDPECQYLICHKGNYRLRCKVSRSPNHKPVVAYFIDGVKVSKEEAMAITRPSAWNKPQKENWVYTVKLENVVALKEEAKALRLKMIQETI